MRRPTATRYLSVDEAAKYLGVGRTTIYKAVRERRLPNFRDPLTGRLKFDVDVLDKMYRDGKP